MKNQELLEKTMATSDILSAGRLNAQQQERFIVTVRKMAALLGSVRFAKMTNPRADLDKLHIGEPVTSAATENSDASTTKSKAKFNKVSLEAVKVKTYWELTKEFISNNLEQDNIEDTIFMAIIGRIAQDLETLGLRGDTATVGSDPMDLLLVTLDGWLKKADSAHILDAAGGDITWNLFAAAWRRLPKHFRTDPGLRWIISDTAINDWQGHLKSRETPVGDQNLVSSVVNPMGVPMMRVPNMPDDLSVTAGAASPAQVIGGRSGPFVITSTANKVKLDINNVGATTVTLTAGTFVAAQVAAEINAHLVAAGGYGATFANFARDNGLGELFLESPTTGAASEIEVAAVANDAHDILGLTEAVVAGAAAATATVLEGTTILLTNPKNLVFGMLDGTRVFSEYNKNYDRIETVIYNEVDFEIEELDGLVKIKNVKLSSLGF